MSWSGWATFKEHGERYYVASYGDRTWTISRSPVNPKVWVLYDTGDDPSAHATLFDGKIETARRVTEEKVKVS